MGRRKVDLGTAKVVRIGGAVGIKLPYRWLTTHGLKIGDPVYSVLTVDQEMRVHLEPVDWARKAKIRRAAQRGSVYMTMSAPYVREMGIEAGSRVRLIADVEHGVLSIWREA